MTRPLYLPGFDQPAPYTYLLNQHNTMFFQ